MFNEQEHISSIFNTYKYKYLKGLQKVYTAFIYCYIFITQAPVITVYVVSFTVESTLMLMCLKMQEKTQKKMLWSWRM